MAAGHGSRLDYGRLGLTAVWVALTPVLCFMLLSAWREGVTRLCAFFGVLLLINVFLLITGGRAYGLVHLLRWQRQRRDLRRDQSGRCIDCGHLRAGIADEAKCPECGARRL